MVTVEDLLAQAKLLPAAARRELRDKLDASLGEPGTSTAEGPYAALLALAGTARSEHSDVSAKKNKHLAEVLAGKPRP